VILLDLPTLLNATADLPGSPDIDDFGVPAAAIARHGTVVMDTRVYGSVSLRAAALMQTLLLLPFLSHSQASFAWRATVAYLELCGRTLEVEPADAAQLAADTVAGRVTVAQIASTLKSWSRPAS
jgi:hypothetical protein